MDRFALAQALVRRAEEQANTCKVRYERSLHARHVDADLLIEIKQIIDGLRSALDYCARELFARFCKPRGDVKVYFPIAKKGVTAAEFPTFLNSKIPGLGNVRPDLAALLSSLQAFSAPVNAWLPDLATLSNENKHENLTPQTRTETRELRVESLGAGISIGGGAAISLGAGTSIQIGGATIPGGQVLKPGDPVKMIGDGSVQDIIWVGFLFDSIAQPVIPFLTRAVAGVGGIIEAVRAAV